MWCSVAIVRIDVSEERISSIIRMKRISELIFLRSVLWLPDTANVVLSSLIVFTLMMEAIRPSEKSVLAWVTRRHIPEDGILHSHRLENLKSYVITILLSEPTYGSSSTSKNNENSICQSDPTSTYLSHPENTVSTETVKLCVYISTSSMEK
jgi:hypothetical protein